jgi:hypothetical protein
MRQVAASIRLPVAPRRALAAFLDPEDLQSRWGVERALVEPRVGGVHALAWGVTEAGFKYVSTGVIGEYDPARLLRIDHYTNFNPARPILGPLGLHLEAVPEGGRTRLDLIQDGYREGPDWDGYHDAVAAAWPVALQALEAHLAAPPGT